LGILPGPRLAAMADGRRSLGRRDVPHGRRWATIVFMTKKAKALLDQALKLTPAERAEVMDGLATSLQEDEEFDLHPEWRAEIERRVERIVSGKTKGIPIGTAMKKLRRSLERKRRARGKTSSR
jgi:putative addiction module component (TIGR02574 family)